MGFNTSDWDNPETWQSEWILLDNKLTEFSVDTNLPISAYPDFQKYIVTSISVASAFRRNMQNVLDRAYLTRETIKKIENDIAEYKKDNPWLHKTEKFQKDLDEFQRQKKECSDEFFRFRSIVSETLAARVDKHIAENRLQDLQYSSKSFADALRSFLSRAGGKLYRDRGHMQPKKGHAKDLLEAQLGVGQLGSGPIDFRVGAWFTVRKPSGEHV